MFGRNSYGWFCWLNIFFFIVAAGRIGGDDQLWVSRWVRRCGGDGRDSWLGITTGYEVISVVVVN